MKHLFCCLIAIALVSSSFTQTGNRTHDKDFLLNYFEQTFENLEEVVEGLSEKQLQFKLAPEKWSVSQCLEHIVLSEKLLLGLVKQAMESEPAPGRKEEVKITDEGLIGSMTDRSFKAQAPKVLVPKEKGIYKSAAKALEDLRNQRQEILDYISDISLEDMRSRVWDSPFGPIDGYHSFLYISAHTARHTLQIEEIKTNITFPKK
ncbi:MAG: DinB family protein [Chitinophagaceae bacterium]|nr:DinB family protein [Chitinophagaceae bacterium]MCW5929630.1 DinB family protein [Chitinophagaceae bacterium]